jgi:M6 family metalloprotease-like protein
MKKQFGLYVSILIGVVFVALLLTASYTSQVQARAARNVAISGTVTVIWGDSFEIRGEKRINRASQQAFLIDEQGEIFKLVLESSTLRKAGGYSGLYRKQVTVRGQQLSAGPADAGYSRLRVEAIDLIDTGEGRPGRSRLSLGGNQPWLTVMCKFPDDPDEPRPLAYFKDMYANSYPWLDHYWRELSNNHINLSGSYAAGWYTLPHLESYYTIDDDGDGTPDRLFNLARDCATLADPDNNYTQYKGINLMFNTASTAGHYGGSAKLELDGLNQFWPLTWIWADGYQTYENPGLFVVEHEMGHGFGLPHSGVMGTYDSQWDVMSGGAAWVNGSAGFIYSGVQTNSYHKNVLGWIEESRHYAVDEIEEVTLTLEQSAQPGANGYLIVTIPAKRSPNVYYTVEARKWAGYDNGLPAEGVLIHRVDASDPVESRVIDLDGDITTLDDQAFTVGETYFDFTDNVTVTVDSETAGGYKVSIKTGPPPPPFTDCATQPILPVKECLALVAIYDATDGSNWREQTGWKTAPNPCDWYGVQCGEGHVYSLWMVGNGMAGPLPEEIGDLTNLEILTIAAQNLAGPIPASIGNLVRLRELKLNFNGLTGAIPQEFGNLTQIEILEMPHNEFSGQIPAELGNLVNVWAINLSHNQLSGPIPAELGNLINLWSLTLSDNLLSGSIPPELSKLESLWFMDLDRNQLTGCIPSEFGNLVELRNLYVDRNALACNLPKSLANLTNLGTDWQSADSNFGYNSLTAKEPKLIAFLNKNDPDWAETQTLPPSDIAVNAISSVSVEVNWKPIVYTGDGGYYEVSIASQANGSFAVQGATSDKLATGYTVTGLSPGEKYYVKVRTFTPAHFVDYDDSWGDGDQKNDLWSSDSEVVEFTIPLDASTPTATVEPTPTLSPTPGTPAGPTPESTATMEPTPSVTPAATETPSVTGYSLYLPLIRVADE